MRKVLIGLLLAATAAAPALADKGGKGHGGPKAAAPAAHGGGSGKHGFQGGGPRQAAPPARGGFVKHDVQRSAPRQAFKAPRQGGGAKAARAFDRGFVQARAPQRWHAPDKRSNWQRPARFDRPVNVVRVDDKQARKAWKHAAKDERKFRQAVARQDRFRASERWARAAPVVVYDRRPVYRPAARYAVPSVVRYAPIVYTAQNWSSYDDYSPSYDPWMSRYGGWSDDYYAPQSYGAYADDDGYWPANYGASYSADPSYGQGLFGGGGLLGTLLPVLLQSIMGGDLGGLSGLGGLTGLGSDINVLPLQQASYAPYLSDGSDALLPSLLGSGGFF